MLGQSVFAIRSPLLYELWYKRQLLFNVASSQYGGCSADRIDEVLEPFALKNYDKHLAEAKEYITDTDKQAEFAKKRTKKDIYDAMQGSLFFS